MMIRSFGCLSLWCALLVFSVSAQGVDFGNEIVIHRDNAPFQFGRNTRGVLGVDSMGHVHLVYWVPDETSNPPDNQIWYMTIEDGQASAPIRVDSGEMGGGRHPALAIDASNTVHVVWQDYRHTTSLGHYIDNIEIYYDKKPAEGSFFDTDIRISHSNAGHLGDNGFVPGIVLGPENRIHVVWYDFGRDGTSADVYLRSSTDQGEFPAQTGIEQFRITNAGLSDEYTGNWMPGAALLNDGSVYPVWGFLQGWQGDFRIQGRRIAPDGTLGPVDSISETGSSFFDPVRLASDRNGNLGLVYSARVSAQSVVQFQYRPNGGEWSQPVVLNSGMSDASQPDVVFDSAGKAYVVWQEDNFGFYQIHFATIEPESLSVEGHQVLSFDDMDARTPAIALHSITDQLHIVWIDRTAETEQTIVYRARQLTAIDLWQLH
ncbi:MAG: hypothetical protein ABIH23_36040 [bacterium]